VGLPLGWILGSPIFIRTELDEGAPVAVGAPGTEAPSVAPASGGSDGGSGGGGKTVLSGSLSGADEFHFASGEVLLIETAADTYVLRFERISVRNGPDLFVYLSPSPDGYADDAIELGKLKASDGSFNYEVPAGTDISRFKSAVIWCRAFSVQFAAAPLAA
ncbi:MAG: DM13 domain-containing protein, partial [Actinobacteria bacterium]|nr:DM13 domain-containing protein [Actinomycetota bacterium]